jgi:hypothetical protein
MILHNFLNRDICGNYGRLQLRPDLMPEFAQADADSEPSSSKAA